jgi:inorganic pyrophosphatase
MPRKAATRRVRPKLLDRLEPFEDDCVMVVIETPKGSPNKLAFEPRYGTFILKGVLPAGAVFPFDFGFVPSTREDGDPLDVLVLMDARYFPDVLCLAACRCHRSRAIEDGKTERNDRLLAVAANSAAHRSIHELRDLSPDLVAQIEHFYVSYNEMKGKQFRVKVRRARGAR